MMAQFQYQVPVALTLSENELLRETHSFPRQNKAQFAEELYERCEAPMLHEAESVIHAALGECPFQVTMARSIPSVYWRHQQPMANLSVVIEGEFSRLHRLVHSNYFNNLQLGGLSHETIDSQLRSLEPEVVAAGAGTAQMMPVTFPIAEMAQTVQLQMA